MHWGLCAEAKEEGRGRVKRGWGVVGLERGGGDLHTPSEVCRDGCSLQVCMTGHTDVQANNKRALKVLYVSVVCMRLWR